jgi:hypothetical protein
MPLNSVARPSLTIAPSNCLVPRASHCATLPLDFLSPSATLKSAQDLTNRISPGSLDWPTAQGFDGLSIKKPNVWPALSPNTALKKSRSGQSKSTMPPLNPIKIHTGNRP